MKVLGCRMKSFIQLQNGISTYKVYDTYLQQEYRLFQIILWFNDKQNNLIAAGSLW